MQTGPFNQLTSFILSLSGRSPKIHWHYRSASWLDVFYRSMGFLILIQIIAVCKTQKDQTEAGNQGVFVERGDHGMHKF